MRQILLIGIVVAFLAGVAQGQILGPITGRAGPGGPTATVGQVPDDPAAEHNRMVRVCQDRIQSAKKAIAEDHWGSAVTDLNYGASFAIEPALVTQIRQLYQQCQDEGARQLDVAKKDYEAENYLSAIKSYEVISRTFGSLPCAQQARLAAKAAQADPKARSAIQEAQVAGMNDVMEAIIASGMRKASQPAAPAGATTSPSPSAAPPPLKPTPIAALPPSATQPAAPSSPGRPPESTTCPAAPSPAIATTTVPAVLTRADKIKLLDLAPRVQVVDTLEHLAKLCPLAPTGNAAAADLAELQKDQAFWDTIKTYRDEKKIEQAFKKAELYEKQGMLKKAKEFYEQVAADYPQHPLGQRARIAALGIDIDLKNQPTPAPSGQ